MDEQRVREIVWEELERLEADKWAVARARDDQWLKAHTDELKRTLFRDPADGPVVAAVKAAMRGEPS